jgi:CheY-like chemotaxis protein
MKRIAVIEDDEFVRANLLELLSLEGYDARGASDGAMGVSLVADFLPHLVVCDVAMPEMSGHDVLSALKEAEATRSIPFIFLTAAAEREDFRIGLSLGADDYLTKPFLQQELLVAIEEKLAAHLEEKTVDVA